MPYAEKGHPGMTDEDMKALGSRRDFFKKMVALGFAIPVISSFSLEGVAAADDDFNFRHNNGGNLGYGNGSSYGNGDDCDDHRHHQHHRH